MRFLKIVILVLAFPALAFAQSYPSPTYNNVTVNGAAALGSNVTITGGAISGISPPIPVASGGTNAATASGTALDNITGFASTGFLTRTGAGAYSFQSLVNGITLGNLAQVAANTVLANATGSTANLAAFAMPSCSTSSSAITWTTSTGFTCNTAINAATLLGGTWAIPGTIGSTTPNTGAFSGLTSNNGLTTATSIYQSIFPAQTFSDQAQSVFKTPASNTLGQMTAAGVYIQNISPVSGINGNAVAYFGAGTAEVNNAATWGVNTLLQDASSRVAGSGTGRILIGHEADFNVMNPGTEVLGISVGGNSLAQSTNAQAYVVNTLGTGFHWTTGLLSQDGAATNGISLGMSSATLAANVNSQPQLFQFGDGNGVKQNISVTATSAGTGVAGGFLVVGGSSTQNNLQLTNGSLFLANTANGVYINGSPQVGASTARVFASNTSGQSIPNSATTTVTGWTTSFDQASNFVASTGVFTAPVTGYYNVSASITYSATMPVGTVQALDIVSNGSIVFENQVFVPTTSAAQNTLVATALVKLTSGQTLHISTFQGSGAAVTLNTTGAHNTLSIMQTPG